MNTYFLFLIGVAVGAIIACVIAAFHTAYGTLEIDESDPEKDIYQIQIEDLDSLSKKKYLKCKIAHK